MGKNKIFYTHGFGYSDGRPCRKFTLLLLFYDPELPTFLDNAMDNGPSLLYMIFRNPLTISSSSVSTFVSLLAGVRYVLLKF